MGRLHRVLGAVATLLPIPLVAAMVAHVPDSAYVVPSVHIATADEPIRLTPADLGARRTTDGLEVDEVKLEAAIETLAQRFVVHATPATYELRENEVALNDGAPGAELDRDAARTLLLDALSGRLADPELPVREVVPPPPPRNAIVVRLADYRLELYEGTRMLQHYIVGVGQLQFPTPPGVYHIRQKAKNPTWRNPGSRWSRSMPSYIPPGPRNPLGTRALRLDREAIVIHGTPNPSTVGRRSSHGCIRMKKADVEALFELVPEGTPVFIIP